MSGIMSVVARLQALATDNGQYGLQNTVSVSRINFRTFKQFDF
jgi:hypothetical protein